MRILIDTNIIVSSLVTPQGRIAALLKWIMDNHTICIATFSVTEVEIVITEKYPENIPRIDDFFNDFTYELLHTPSVLPETPHIRDAKDRPILATAIQDDVDILLSGDKDFSEVEIERPRIMTPAEFRLEFQ